MYASCDGQRQSSIWILLQGPTDIDHRPRTRSRSISLDADSWTLLKKLTSIIKKRYRFHSGCYFLIQNFTLVDFAIQNAPLEISTLALNIHSYHTAGVLALEQRTRPPYRFYWQQRMLNGESCRIDVNLLINARNIWVRYLVLNQRQFVWNIVYGDLFTKCPIAAHGLYHCEVSYSLSYEMHKKISAIIGTRTPVALMISGNVSQWTTQYSLKRAPYRTC